MEHVEQQFKEYLAANKLKYTPERRKIFNEVFSSRDRFDADELFVRLRSHSKRVSRATVYRTLDLLIKLGLVRRVCLGDRSALFENVFSWKQHGNLICKACGKIQEFKIKEIEERLEAVCKQNAFEAQSSCIQIFGYCSQCKAAVLSKCENKLSVLKELGNAKEVNV
ncbi:MAG: Fur family transcriptional regulator [bacterium]